MVLRHFHDGFKELHLTSDGFEVFIVAVEKPFVVGVTAGWLTVYVMVSEWGILRFVRQAPEREPQRFVVADEIFVCAR